MEKPLLQVSQTCGFSPARKIKKRIKYIIVSYVNIIHVETIDEMKTPSQAILVFHRCLQRVINVNLNKTTPFIEN